MKNHKSTLILALIFILSLNISFAQTVDKKVENKIAELKRNSIDTLICYYNFCTAETLDIIVPDSCIVNESKYLFWVDHGIYYSQHFDNCNLYPVRKRDTSEFLEIALSRLDSIRNAEIKIVEHYNKDKNSKVTDSAEVLSVDHSYYTCFDFYIGNESFKKSINKFDLETKMLDEKTANDNFEANQKSILKRLKDLVEEETQSGL